MRRSLPRPYDATRTALFEPAREATFFAAGRPADEPVLAAEMARLAYAPFETPPGAAAATALLRAVGFDAFSPFNAPATDSQAFLASDRTTGLAVLAFRGTQHDRWKDLRADLMAWREPWPAGGEVHHGFAAAFRAIWSLIAPALSPRPTRLLFTGHSLGAALATLAASTSAPDGLYTFGCPRVGDRTFIATLPVLPSHRYVNCADLVPRIPPARWGYAHLEPARYIDRRGRERPRISRAARVLDRLLGDVCYAFRWAWRPGMVWFRAFADHAPVNYLTALAHNDRPVQ